MSSIRRRAQKSAVDKQPPSWNRRPFLSSSRFTLAVIVAIQRVLAHGDFRLIPISMAWQDLPFLGNPPAIALAIAGGIALDPNPRL